MTSLTVDRNNIEKAAFIIVLSELILGGSGRLIAFGPVSVRILMLACLIAVDMYLVYENKLLANQSNLLLLCIITYFTIVLLFSAVNHNTTDAINSFTGYIVIAVSPVFVYWFNNVPDLINTFRKTFYLCTGILSCITLLLWIYSVISIGTVASFLNSYQYGALAYVGRVPRLFLKGSIFICCALFFSITDYLETKEKMFFPLSILYLVAIAVTFTTSFYVFTGVLLLAGIYIHYGKYHFVRFLAAIIAIGIIGVILLYFLGIFDVFAERFSGDYNFSYKGIQFVKVLEDCASSPIWGKGFGYRIKIDYGYTVVTSYSFEIMWLQLLLDTGIIGLSLFGGHVLFTVDKLRYQYNTTGNPFFLAMGLSVIMICLVSFTNPFMNNAIGLLFYSICVGIANTETHEYK